MYLNFKVLNTHSYLKIFIVLNTEQKPVQFVNYERIGINETEEGTINLSFTAQNI